MGRCFTCTGESSRLVGCRNGEPARRRQMAEIDGPSQERDGRCWEDTMDSSSFRPLASRRSLLLASAGLAGGALLPVATHEALAQDKPPLGTWPAGSTGSTVFVGLSVPRTGTYAVPGEDELKGAE